MMARNITSARSRISSPENIKTEKEMMIKKQVFIPQIVKEENYKS